MITGNIGEWSELYAFSKILTDKVIYSADKNLEKIEDNFYYVLQIIREEAKIGKKIYDISKGDQKIHISKYTGEKIGMIDSSKVKLQVKKIFEDMKGNNSAAFSLKVGQNLMNALKCSQIKASSAMKQDLIIKIHDPVTSIKPEMGFSIKSMLGSPSTLLNASGATNFRYKIHCDNLVLETINTIMGRSKIIDRVNKIREMKGEILFESLKNDAFKKNLRKIDSLFPEMLAEIILAFFQGKGRKIPDIVNYLEKEGILDMKFNFNKEDIEYKLKEFLVAIALGMTPSKEWNGITSAHGGYIIVREDGEIVCYNLYNRNEFQEYLYNNTRLDTPSTSKHRYGDFFEENGEKYINLNLQIRFNK